MSGPLVQQFLKLAWFLDHITNKWHCISFNSIMASVFEAGFFSFAALYFLEAGLISWSYNSIMASVLEAGFFFFCFSNSWSYSKWTKNRTLRGVFSRFLGPKWSHNIQLGLKWNSQKNIRQFIFVWRKSMNKNPPLIILNIFNFFVLKITKKYRKTERFNYMWFTGNLLHWIGSKLTYLECPYNFLSTEYNIW